MPSKQPAATWPLIIVSYAVFALFLIGAVTAYAFFVYDTTIACDRPSDSCRVTQAGPFWTEEVARVRLSAVRDGRQEYRRGFSSSGRSSAGQTCTVVEMKDGSPALDICRGSPDSGGVDTLNAFVADGAQPSLTLLVEGHFMQYALTAFLVLFSLLPLYGATSLLLQKLRAPAAARPPGAA